MSIFEKLYINQLESDLKLINSAVTWNTGMHQLHTSNLLKPVMDPKEKYKPRHRKSIIRDPGTRKHTRTIPVMHTKDPNEPLSLRDLKNTKSGRKTLNQDELEKIKSRYNISNLHDNKPKKLGNTGIVLQFDPSVRGYIIQK